MFPFWRISAQPTDFQKKRLIQNCAYVDNFVNKWKGMPRDMQIQIITVGKLKEKYLKQGIAEYEKRLKPYAKVKIIELRDEPTPQQATEKEERQIKAIEGERILAKIPVDSFVIALDLRGKALTSEQLAQTISDQMIYGTKSLVFIIGGSLGLSDEVLSRSDLRLSFGKFTYPHQLMRLILVEQIYRAFKIIRGEPYHK